MAGSKPLIPNVRWRKGVAYGRAQRKGKYTEKSLETTDPREARKRVEKWLKELKDTDWGEKPRRSYDEAGVRFMDEHIGRLKPRSAKRYLQSMQVLSETFEGKRLDQISTALLSEFETARRRQGVQSGTIRHDLFVLSALFTCAEEWEWVQGNPVAAYLRSRKKRGLLLPQPARHRYLSHAEEAELYSRCNLAFGPNRAHMRLMVSAGIALTIDIGLRKEELLAAEWRMVDLERAEWTVPRELDKIGVGRVIPILPRSLAILRSLPRSSHVQYVLWRPERVKRPAPGMPAPEPKHRRIFDLLPRLEALATGGRSETFRREVTKLGAKGLDLTAERRAAIKTLADKLAFADVIPDVRWHDLRRTCGCRLLQDHGMAMEEVSKWLGHQSVEVTEQIYAFLETEHLHAAVRRSLSDERRIRGLLASKKASDA